MRAASGLVAAPPDGASDHAGAYTLRDLLIMAFYHRRAILLAALVAFAVGAGAAVLTRTQFTAESRLLVLVNREQTGGQDLTGLPAVLNIDGLRSVEAETEIIESREVIERVLEAMDPEALFPSVTMPRLFGLLPAYEPKDRMEKAVEMFRSRLRVETQPGSNVVHVSLQLPDREQAARALSMLVSAYLERRKEIFDNPRSSFLAQERTRLADQLHGIEGQIQQIKSESQVVDLAQEILLAANQVDSIVQRRRQVSERRVAIKAEVDSARKRLAALPEKVFDFREQTNQAHNDDDRNILLKLQIERDRMASQYAPEFPGLKELDRKIETVRRAMKGQDKPTFATAREVRNPAVAFLNNHLLTLEIEQDSLDNQLAELDRQHAAAVQKVDGLRTAEAKLSDLERTRDLVETIYRDYTLRAEAARIEEEAAKVRASNVRVVQWATPPVTGQNAAPGFLLAGLVGALLLGGAAGIAATWMRQVYIVPGEPERGLRLPTLASFAESADGFDSPEARRELMHFASLLLDFTVDGRPLDVIQFVATSEGRDETALAEALAQEFAQGHQLSTLVVNLCGRAGTVCALPDPAPAGAAAANSVAGLPAVEGSLPIEPTAVPHLWVSVDAQKAPFGNPRTPLAQTQKFLEELRGRFDKVVVIAPPPTVSHVSRRVTGLVDANVLVLRAEQTRAPAALRLRDVMLASGGDLLGFVLTGRRFHIPKAIYRWL
ncbi:exopolysaccharide transport family protein [Arenibaculum pallidiluteum]|uniref:exopolysaccharide transport family protein n=1 Tax=Arenibaculum pallidiluteum TaxID=2812559 RepID=UPI001F224372|nr:hypothetical protein [Arenibaculum pallidiluteum]